MARRFDLRPFNPDTAPAGLRLEASVDQHHDQLAIRYELQGPLQQLAIPPARSGQPERRDGLWQTTCFEAFLACSGDSGYWECNLSPAGDWNLYRLNGYRNGLRPESAITALPWTAQRGENRLEVAFTLPLQPLLEQRANATGMELSLTAVLQQRGGACSYWAIQHTGPEADFHRRDSFVPI